MSSVGEFSLQQVTPLSPVGSSSASASSQTGNLSAYYPEPSSTGMGVFQDVLSVVKTAAQGIGGVPLEATGGFAELIQAQIQAQIEMQTTSMVSNIERSKHESKMAAIRNIRMG